MKILQALNRRIYFLILLVLGVYLLYMITITRHVSIDYVLEDLILAHLSGFYHWNLMDILFGATSDKVDSSFSTTEISFLKQLASFGLIGLLVFYSAIAYYLFRLILHRGCNDKIIIPLVLILSVFVMGNVHYNVMFYTGFRELFSLILSCVIYMTYSDKNQLKGCR